MAKVMVSIPEEVLKELDVVAREEGITRSALLTASLRYYLRFTRRPRRLIDRPEVQEALARMERLSRADRTKDWDSTAAVRALRDSR